MEHVLERIYPATDENGEYYLYDDEGNGVTNQTTLRALAEAQEIAEEWLAHKKRWKNIEHSKENV